MHDYARLCTTMHDYARLCTTMHDYARLSLSLTVERRRRRRRQRFCSRTVRPSELLSRPAGTLSVRLHTSSPPANWGGDSLSPYHNPSRQGRPAVRCFRRVLVFVFIRCQSLRVPLLDCCGPGGHPPARRHPRVRYPTTIRHSHIYVNRRNLSHSK
jgi:hypothetical protein